jgi:cytochrome c oxidase cbb3-type subunit 3
MPALGAALGSEGTKNAAAYVRSLSGLPHDSLRAQLGKPVFEQTCAACHGMDGKGNQAVGAPNLTDAIWLYGSSEATIMEGINKGRHADGSATAMPAHKDTLGAGKVQILAAYVWGLSNPPK